MKPTNCTIPPQFENFYQLLDIKLTQNETQSPEKHFWTADLAINPT